MRRSSIRKFDTLQALRSLRALALIPTCLALGACASDELSLGTGEAPIAPDEPPPPSCADHADRIVTRDYTARNQAEIDALAGCEQMLGNLEIFGSSNFNLRSLASLRVVRGLLHVGLGEGHTLSLEGLENLEQVGSLRLTGLRTTDLRSLSNLRRVSGDPRPGEKGGGEIFIADSTYLKDLTGLEGLQDWEVLYLHGLTRLESLNGLSLPGQAVGAVSLIELPSLRDVSVLGSVTNMSSLRLINTGLESLDGLNLEYLSSLTMHGNHNLVQVDGAFARIRVMGSMQIELNSRLDHLPELPELVNISLLEVTNNAELRSIPAYTKSTSLNTYGAGGGIEPDEVVVYRDAFSNVEIAYNPKLTQFTLPVGFSEGERVRIASNAGLTDIDLTTLSNVDALIIRDNPLLANIGIPDLETVGDLAIENNPALSVSGLSAVKTFDSTVTGNADAPDDTGGPVDAGAP